MAIRVLTAGAGTTPPHWFDLVRLRFAGWTHDGKLLGTSSPGAKEEPQTVRVSESGIPGLTEALLTMVAGEKCRVWIPAALASDDGSLPDIVMDVDLLGIVPTPQPPRAPDDAARPPPAARRTSSGLYWRLVSSTETIGEQAPKTASPGPLDVASYNLSVWRRSGELVSSSFPAAHPNATTINDLAAPWNEVIPLMKVGDTVRVWFDDDEDGPVVADTELLYLYPVAKEHEGAPIAARRRVGRK